MEDASAHLFFLASLQENTLSDYTYVIHYNNASLIMGGLKKILTIIIKNIYYTSVHIDIAFINVRYVGEYHIPPFLSIHHIC